MSKRIPAVVLHRGLLRLRPQMIGKNCHGVEPKFLCRGAEETPPNAEGEARAQRLVIATLFVQHFKPAHDKPSTVRPSTSGSL